MRYPHILAAIRSAKWAVTPETLQSIRDVLSARLSGNLAPVAGLWDSEAKGVAEGAFEFAAPGVAVVKMHGIIGRNLSGLEMDCGGCDIACVEMNIMEALASPMASSVILDIDSPGGTVSGVPEFSAAIGEMSKLAGKPVVAYISGMGCSAAYWIACGCAGIAAAPSADVGSIGVYMAMIDESANWAAEGYKLVLIKAGDYKGAGIRGSQITPEQMAIWQADVDLIYKQFTDAVRAARVGVDDATMQGQSFYGPRALEAKLVDQLMSIDQLAADVGGSAAA
jgi:signal peptide peptidase SppA